MHSLVFVVVPRGTEDIVSFLRGQMEPHRIVGNPRSDRGARRRGRWDYFTVGGLFDGEILPAGAEKAQPGTVGNNLCPIGVLTRSCGAIVTPDGAWHDAEELGHRLIDPPERQRIALEAWEVYLQRLLEGYPDAAVVAVDAHS